MTTGTVTHATLGSGRHLALIGVERSVDDWTETMVVEGRTLTIRPIHDDDVDRLRRLFYRLSPQTVYRRFFQPVKRPSEKLLHHLAEVDHDLRQAIVAELDDEIIAVVRYDRASAWAVADIAVLVEDAWQGHGLGRKLLRRLAVDALEHGVVDMSATVLGENQRALRLARHLAPETHSQLDHGEWLLDFHVPQRDGRELADQISVSPPSTASVWPVM